MSQQIRVGLLRLVDSAPLVVAEARGLFMRQGLDVRISIEPSWAIILDKLAANLLDAAVMPPPLALAAVAGLAGPKVRLVVPLSLSQGGNAIIARPDAASSLEQAAPSRLRLTDWLRAQPSRPRFAVVHPFSTHNLLLRYWLAAGGADPDGEIDTVAIPPENVVDALAAGVITGFCAGAPWGDVAERRDIGRTLLGTSSIWPFHPEKCLCVAETWAAARPDLLHRLLCAVLQAQLLCDRPEEAPGIASLLASPNGLNLPEAASRDALPGGTGPEQIRFHTREAWFPARAHALWFLGQMRRWDWLPEDVDPGLLAASVYRPDLLASAVEAEGLYPAASLPLLESTAMLPMIDDAAFTPSRRNRR